MCVLVCTNGGGAPQYVYNNIADWRAYRTVTSRSMCRRLLMYIRSPHQMSDRRWCWRIVNICMLETGVPAVAWRRVQNQHCAHDLFRAARFGVILALCRLNITHNHMHMHVAWLSVRVRGRAQHSL